MVNHDYTPKCYPYHEERIYPHFFGCGEQNLGYDIANHPENRCNCYSYRFNTRWVELAQSHK